MSSTSPAESYIVNRLLVADVVVEEAHAVLDARSVPRTDNGQTVSLATRIRALVGEVILNPIGSPVPLPRHDYVRPGDVELDDTATPEADDYVPPDAHYRNG